MSVNIEKSVSQKIKESNIVAFRVEESTDIGRKLSFWYSLNLLKINKKFWEEVIPLLSLHKSFI
jgi:hypothetical protein